MANKENSTQDPAVKTMGCMTVVLVLIGAFLFAILLSSCSPKIIEKVRTEVEYRDRVVHDTATVQVPVEVEKIVTRDTSSHLENSFAKSDAMVSGGLLSHSLESKPQYIKVPVEVHVTDTLYKESEIKTEYVKVEKDLTGWQKFRLGAFWWLIALCLFGFRREILSLIKLFI